MSGVIKDYLVSKSSLMDYFQCCEDYYIKLLEDYLWRVKENNGIYFLTYWKKGGRLQECVIVKKSGRPLIFRQSDYTMIVCIECVKIALVLKTENEV